MRSFFDVHNFQNRKINLRYAMKTTGKIES